MTQWLIRMGLVRQESAPNWNPSSEILFNQEATHKQVLWQVTSANTVSSPGETSGAFLSFKESISRAHSQFLLITFFTSRSVPQTVPSWWLSLKSVGNCVKTVYQVTHFVLKIIYWPLPDNWLLPDFKVWDHMENRETSSASWEKIKILHSG